MSDMKHTPGPWTLDGPCGFTDPKAGSMIYAPHGNGHLVATLENQHSPKQQPANARLIAAAPDLLEAIDGLTTLLMLNADASEVATSIKIACKAITKATGGGA